VPPIVFSALRVFGEQRKLPVAISLTKQIRLDVDEKIFSLEFAVLDYTFPRRNRYAYMLEGVGNRWIDIGTKRDVTFTDLAPGNYALYVKGTNSDGIWGEKSASVRIMIPPPIWATWWFRGLVVLAFLGALFGAHRFRVRALEARERELEARVEEELSQIKILKGLLPICAVCKKVRDDSGYWNQMETYIREHSQADFSHGICPDCIPTIYPEYQGKTKKRA
jgi:hypothetical protein